MSIDIDNRIEQGAVAANETAESDEINGSSPLDIALAEIELLRKQLDSARRTYGEELSIFAGEINKRLDKLEKVVYSNG